MFTLRDIQSKPPILAAWRDIDAFRVGGDGPRGESSAVAEETPIAFRYGGFPHAVMMATPDDLADFVAGFSLTEGIIDGLADVARLEMRDAEDGITVDVTLTPAAMHRHLAGRRVRQLRGHTSCGLCGAEDLHDVHRPPARIDPARRLAAPRIDAALAALRGFQPLSRRTHGAHAAAWVAIDGTIRAVREDIGRHNALDKLIGAGLNGAFAPAQGFCLITSRCSFEMVQKALAAGFGTLVALSAPTALAVRTAATTGLALFSLGRDDTPLLYTPSAPVTPTQERDGDAR